MKIDNVTEVNISIEEVMDEDKSPKDRCVESATDRIHEAISINSKYARKFSTVVEEQLRRAWNEGYKYAYGTCWKNVAEQKNTTKELWEMMQTIGKYYDVEDLEEAFGCYTLETAIRLFTLEDFINLFRAYEEKRKIIHVGDEIEWETVDPAKPHVGIALAVNGDDIKVLTYSAASECFTKASLNPNKVTKTGRHFADLFKEES